MNVWAKPFTCDEQKVAIVALILCQFKFTLIWVYIDLSFMPTLAPAPTIIYP